jgi:hypothetical protein
LQVAKRAVAVGRRSLRELVPPYKTHVFANETPSRRCPSRSHDEVPVIAHQHPMIAHQHLAQYPQRHPRVSLGQHQFKRGEAALFLEQPQPTVGTIEHMLRITTLQRPSTSGDARILSARRLSSTDIAPAPFLIALSLKPPKRAVECEHESKACDSVNHPNPILVCNDGFARRSTVW